MALFVYSDDYYADIGAHVFPIVKFRILARRLVEKGLIAPGGFEPPAPCTRDDLALVHVEKYLDDLFELRWTQRTWRSELPLSEEIVRAYVIGTGGTIRACELALQYGAAMNLTGGFHHAFPDHAEGFCYVNDVAVAVRKMQKLRRTARAAIIDCDLHQGNGTAFIFQRDPTVFTFSIHQEKNYPIKEKSDLDIGLDDGTGDDEYLEHLKRYVPKILDEFCPDLVVYLAGADPYEGDQLGNLRLTKDGLRKRDELVLSECHRRRTPVAIVLAGGYAFHTEDTVEIHMNTCRVMCSLFRPAQQRSADEPRFP